MSKKLKIQFFVWAHVILVLTLVTAPLVTANQSPIAVALPENQTIYVGTEAWFSANDSYDPDGSISSYFWDFQDGTYSSDPYTTHFYNLPGNYTVILTITDDQGATDQDTVNITVIDSSPGNTTVWIQYLAVDKEEYAMHEAINVTIIVERDYGNEPQIWYGTMIFEVFNDSMALVHYDEREVILPEISPSSVSIIEFNLSQAGDHILRASLYDNNSVFVHRKEISVYIVQDPQNRLPVALISLDDQTVNIGDTVYFYGHQSHDPDGVIISYQWDFGDGNFTDEVDPSHVYDAAGIYSVTLTVTDDDLASTSDTISLEVVLSGGDPADGNGDQPIYNNRNRWSGYLAAIAAVGVISFLIGVYGTEAGRYRFLGFFIPLYTKLKKEEILDHFTRGKIYGYILANPGDHYNSIKKALELSDGSFSHHIYILEKEGIIRSARDGTYRRFYPPGMRIPENGGSLKKSQLLIMEKIRESPGISQKDIASLLGVSSPTVNYHMKKLLHLGIIRGERAGMRVRYYLNARGEEVDPDTMA
ncbi:MAG: PKD domain-containing protein [Methanomassiliicoccales archaeon]|nr:MAG: PKD domain-containing protein [Methanomassiliicoccales archaeon]